MSKKSKKSSQSTTQLFRSPMVHPSHAQTITFAGNFYVAVLPPEYLIRQLEDQQGRYIDSCKTGIPVVEPFDIDFSPYVEEEGEHEEDIARLKKLGYIK